MIRLLLAGLVLAGLLLALCAAPAMAHMAASGLWQYPASCCDNKDCAEISRDDVEPTPEGWRIRRTGEVIPYSRTRPSPDGRFHHCAYSDGQTIGWSYKGVGHCFWAPMESAAR